MTGLTKVRRALEEAVPIEEPVKVLMAPTSYESRTFGAEPDELMLSVRVIVGEPSDVTEDRVDKLVEMVPEMIEADHTLGGIAADVRVTGCSGHRLFPIAPNVPPQLGVEWSVRMMRS